MSTASNLAEPECLAVTDAEVAKLLHISRRHVANLDASGRLPRALRFGRAKRWILPELRAWMAAGAPSRDRWEAAKGGGKQ
jgi:predicted DNA-binding transcriptional regulator AlpA